MTIPQTLYQVTYLHFSKVLGLFSPGILSCSFLWNIFPCFLILLYFLCFFYVSGKTTTSPGIEMRASVGDESHYLTVVKVIVSCTL